MNVYFKHETLTPDNIREVWDDADHVPRVGEQVHLNAGRNLSRKDARTTFGSSGP